MIYVPTAYGIHIYIYYIIYTEYDLVNHRRRSSCEYRVTYTNNNRCSVHNNVYHHILCVHVLPYRVNRVAIKIFSMYLIHNNIILYYDVYTYACIYCIYYVYVYFNTVAVNARVRIVYTYTLFMYIFIIKSC